MMPLSKMLMLVIVTSLSLSIMPSSSFLFKRTVTSSTASLPFRREYSSSSSSSSMAIQAISTSAPSEQQLVHAKNGNSQEYFSVAPMMAHTNRHHRYMFRTFLSQKCPLYTEMIPASQIVTAFHSPRKIASDRCFHADTLLRTTATDSNNHQETALLEAYFHHSLQLAKDPFSNLSQLLQIFSSVSSPYDCDKDPARRRNGESFGPVILQLGGRDPRTLAQATAIAAVYGYSGVNLNCGCPSTAVSTGRSVGAALMLEPSVVARCVEAMSHAAQIVGCSALAMPMEISVKHRIGVRDMAQYQREQDVQVDDAREAFPECRDFVRAISFGSSVSKLHIHARLALLQWGNSDLWTPQAGSSLVPDDFAKPKQHGSTKVDYKRQQYKAKQRARQETLSNRSVPPLRPNVVDMVAEEFPHLQVISNGGMQTMEDVKERTQHRNVAGAMVGRAVINHPCAFSCVDDLWQRADDRSGTRSMSTANASGEDKTPVQTRGSILLSYTEYCQREEEFLVQHHHQTKELYDLRRKLVAAPFHLLVGEDGCNAYQRRVRKLSSRIERFSAASILQGALAEVSSETLDKPVTEYTPLTHQTPAHSRATPRSGPLQRQIF